MNLKTWHILANLRQVQPNFAVGLVAKKLPSPTILLTVLSDNIAMNNTPFTDSRTGYLTLPETSLPCV